MVRHYLRGIAIGGTKHHEVIQHHTAQFRSPITGPIESRGIIICDPTRAPMPVLVTEDYSYYPDNLRDIGFWVHESYMNGNILTPEGSAEVGDVIHELRALRDEAMYQSRPLDVYELWQIHLRGERSCEQRRMIANAELDPTLYADMVLAHLRSSRTQLDDPVPEVVYGDDMEGMTLEEFQRWTDDLIAEIGNDRDEIDA